MDRKMTIRGLPHSLAMDGWWLDGVSRQQGAAGDGAAVTRGRWHLLAMLILLVLGDFLFWRHAPGISAALFALALFALAVRHRSVAEWLRPAGLLLVAALPVLDHVQALSLAFLTAGLIAALIWSRHPRISPAQLTRSSARFIGSLPRQWLGLFHPRRLQAALRIAGQANQNGGRVRLALRNWAFPVGGGMVLLALLLDANPVLAQLVTMDLVLVPSFGRLLFWLGLAILVAPLLGPMPEAETAPRPARPALPLPGLGINAGSVLRALVLFNLLIGAQSLTDLSILLGGTALPKGMTLAEYAHRGAYPLLATAILAGGFALAARPFLHEHRLIRPLLLLWLAQNMVLCAAAALRLELYIDAFGLTYLRVHALIWMALVATGLGMVIWQVTRARPNGWLMWRLLSLGAGTLYLCCFVNFAQLIAAHNVAHGVADDDYLCALGPLAAGPVVAGGIGQRTGDTLWLDECRMDLPAIRNWREWGFRSWAASRYVLRVTQAKTHQ